MDIPRLLSLCSVPLLWAAPVAAQQTAAPPTSTPSTARAVFMNPDGKPIGSATLTETPTGVLISVELSSLPPGVHGFHVHEIGRCDPASGFESAGGHYNPGAARHGYLVEGGPHAGDMPNQTVEQDGKLKAEVFNPSVMFTSGRAPLFDQDGSALVVHATADDHRSQPSGNAGSRLACAVIQR
jgi:superoxide dismutase, Cu-Zn family